MNKEEKWNAYDSETRKDGSWDGRFYIAVKTTGIFCLPSCKARPPLRKNIELLDSVDECLTAGYRPCKRCHPDRA
ncbi:MAG: Ada metal-binding domain-containing protein [Eubacteriales bacterium]|jgi:AraC family transcriptional regulator of adaptative response / methylphosphotriester-DNA alkyltransferase methyltransferase|nr:Ada metal-binding domain-containing protein [Eubacteriales bacterium]MDD3289368.1 Ada metal-binding domain-containing protein [Eubacteriales bacterium]MDD3863020.1 Ada metal-binding domain-containing protein [Eubacteriales bacterium]MDD4444922.1 Ada metal-binding domain-containing protein [Eubacteriales bacterium]